MAKIKISQLTAKGSSLANTDLLPIAEVSGLAYITKRVTGAQVSSSGAVLTVGTTAIVSGTIGRVFFQGTGNVLQQSANFFWDNTNSALGIGITPTSPLHITTGITASAGVARTVNITNTLTAAANNDILTSLDITPTFSVGAFTGVQRYAARFGGSIMMSGNAGAQGGYIRTTLTANSILVGYDNGAVYLGYEFSTLPVHIGTGNTSNVRFRNNGNTLIDTGNLIVGSTTSSNTYKLDVYGTTRLQSNVAIGLSSFGTSATNTLSVLTGIAPGSSPTDAFQMYSADIVGGNAAPHFRTENGNIVKIYQETTGVASATFVQNSGTRVDEVSTFDGYTIAQVVKALRNLGILA